MNEFNPGDGWREVPPEDRRAEVQWYGNPAGLDPVKAWIRVPPVPPLPTESGAVVQWQDGAYLPQIAQLDPGDRHLGWWAPDDHGDPRWMTAEQLQRRIGSDKWTLLEPRAVTAKAVLDRVRAAGIVRIMVAANPKNGDQFDEIARDFGVSS